MDSTLLQMMGMHYYHNMGNRLEQHLELCMDYHLVHLYVGSELGSLEGSADGDADGNLYGLLLGD